MQSFCKPTERWPCNRKKAKGDVLTGNTNTQDTFNSKANRQFKHVYNITYYEVFVNLSKWQYFKG